MDEKKKDSQIYVCSSDLKGEELAKNIGKYLDVQAVKLTDDPCLLRRVLSDCDNESVVVVDTVQASMDQKNIAQALICDKRHVILLDDVDEEDSSLLFNYFDPEEIEVIARDKISGLASAKPEALPAKDLIIPEDDFAWDNLRSTLKQMGSRCRETVANSTDDDLEEIDDFEELSANYSPSSPCDRALSTSENVRGKSIAFCSGRGGTGKSTLISLAGSFASSWGLKVIMLDLDLFCGNLYMHFGEPSISSLTSVREVDCNMDVLKKRYIQKVSKTNELYLLGALEHPEEAELVYPYFERLYNNLINEFDLVLIDMPRTWSEYDVRIMRQVDRLIVVADERASSVSSMIRTMNLANRLGVVRTKMIRLINRCDTYGFDQKFIQKAEEGSFCSHTYYVEDGGRQVSEKLSQGEAIELIRSKNPCIRTWSQAFSKVLQNLGFKIGLDARQSEPQSLLQSLFPFLIKPAYSAEGEL